MSCLIYPPTNEGEIFRHCTKECGIITSTEDQQYFALGCIACSEKFLFFDAFIEHMQTRHVSYGNNGSNTLAGSGGSMYGRNTNSDENIKRRPESDSEEDLTTLLQPPVGMIKEEKIEEDDDDDNGTLIQNEPLGNDDDDNYAVDNYSVKQEQTDPEISMDVGDSSYLGDSYGSYNDDYGGEDDDLDQSNNDDNTNYDDLVEESLLENKRKSLNTKTTYQETSSSASRMKKLRKKRKDKDPNYTTNETKRLKELRKRKRENLSENQLKAIRLEEKLKRDCKGQKYSYLRLER